MASSSNVRIPSRTLFEKYLTLLFVSLRHRSAIIVSRHS
jgi:hypothetical protein